MSAMPNDAHQRVKETAAPSPEEVTASAAAAAKKEQAKPVAAAPAPASSPKTPAADSAKKDAASTKEEPARKKQKMYTPLLPSTLNPTAPGGGEIRLNFVQRLMELLEKEDVQPLLHWTKDGRRIVIEDVTRFSEKVMPRYFSDTKYKSFMVRVKRELMKEVHAVVVLVVC